MQWKLWHYPRSHADIFISIPYMQEGKETARAGKKKSNIILYSVSHVKNGCLSISVCTPCQLVSSSWPCIFLDSPSYLFQLLVEHFGSILIISVYIPVKRLFVSCYPLVVTIEFYWSTRPCEQPFWISYYLFVPYINHTCSFYQYKFNCKPCSVAHLTSTVVCRQRTAHG